MTGDDCCKDCPDRRVGCHNVDTCSKWAAHEAGKKELYDKRLNCATNRFIEGEHLFKRYREVHHDRQNGRRY